jgi:hypothetical protein
MFQKNSFENSSLGIFFWGKEDPKKDNSPKCKVNTLDCYMLFGPLKVFYNHWIISKLIDMLN